MSIAVSGVAMQRSRRSPGQRVLAVAIAVLVLLGVTAGSAVADTTAATGDESVQSPASWAVYTGQTTSQVTSLLGSTYRLVDVRPASNGTYTVTMVKNSGAYAVSGWWCYVHATAAQVSNFLSTNTARLISLERNADGTFNVVMVSNTGSAARGWWWYYGQTPAQISAALSANNARLVSLAADKAGGTYSVVMVPNTGSDAKGWWWYYGQ